MSRPTLIPNQMPQWLQIAYQSLDSEFTSIAFSETLNQVFLTGTTLELGVSFIISGTSILKPITSSKSAFVVCLDANTGAYIWHSWILGSGDQIPTTILLTNSDTEVLISGTSTTTDSDSFSISGESVSKPVTVGLASFIVNLSISDGSYNWSSWIDGTGDEYILDMRLASDGSIYTVGHSSTTGTTINIGGVSQTKPETTAITGFLVKWTASGSYNYSQWFYGSDNTLCRSCKVDTTTGDIIVCGDTLTTGVNFTISGTAVTKPTTTFVSAFVFRLLAADGTYVWDKWIYNSKNTFGNYVGIDNDTGAIYVAGRSNESETTFFVSGINIQKPVTTNYSGYIIRLNTDGSYATNTWIDGPDFDYITELNIVSSQSIVYVMGSSSSTGNTLFVNQAPIQKPLTQNSAGFIIALNLQTLNYLYGLWLNGSFNEYNRGFIVQNDTLYFIGISNSPETQLTEGEYTLSKPLTSAVFGYANRYRIDPLVFLRNVELINATARKVTLYRVSGRRGSTPNFGLADVITTAVTGITSASAVSGGTVLTDRGVAVTARGVCWNTTGNPTIANSRTTNGSGLGSFVSNVSGLNASTNYFLRAYATNINGTVYGNQFNFTTEAGVAVPLALWLDGSDSSTFTLNGSRITQWRDKSGNNRHATQATLSFCPTLVNENTISFDGSTQYFDINLDWLAARSHSAFFVIRVISNYTNIYGAATGGQNQNSLHVGFNFGPSQYRINYWGNDYYPSVSASFRQNQYNLLNYDWINNTSKSVRANRNLEGTQNQQGIIGTMAGGGRIMNVVGQGYMQCEIREVMFILDENITDANRKIIEDYLISKWSI